jgi:uncharacterized membrane protein YraQ (UPF0718 family)
MTPAKPRQEQGADAWAAAIGSAVVFLLISPFLNFIVMTAYSKAGQELTLRWLTVHVSLPVAVVVGVIGYFTAKKKSAD